MTKSELPTQEDIDSAQRNRYLEREEQTRILNEKFDSVLVAYGFRRDADGQVRFRQWGDATTFAELARELGLEVEVIEPSNEDIKKKIFLGEYFRIVPRRIISDDNSGNINII